MRRALLFPKLFVHYTAISLFFRKSSTPVSNCGFVSDVSFSVWGDHFNTDIPTLFPTSEGELRNIILKAKENNCRVRPVGGTNSVPGIVAQKTETDVVTVHLAEMKVPSSWNFTLDEDRLEVRAPAGAGLFDLQRFIRPKGYLLRATTASPKFALGGVFLTPSVHGNVLQEDRCTTIMTGVRAMLANGTIVEEFGEEAMQRWRGSLGFLGIATAVRVKVRKDTGYFVETDSFRVKPWTLTEHTSMFSKSIKGYDAVQYLWNPVNNDVLGHLVKFDGDPTFNFSSTAADFDRLSKRFEGIQKKGLTNPWQRIADILLRIVPGKWTLRLMMSQVKRGRKNINASPRDGYGYTTGQTFFSDQMEGHFRCKTDDCIKDGTLFGVMNATRTFIMKWSKNDRRLPSNPISFRFMKVKSTDVFILNTLPKGRYISLEFTVPRFLGDRSEPFTPYLQGVENTWRKFSLEHCKTKLQYHTGKEWGYGNIPNLPRPYPFQSDRIALDFFTERQRKKFLGFAYSYDPDGVFRAGELARMLGISKVRFDPRHTSKEETQASATSCRAFGGAECLSQCCCKNIFSCSSKKFRQCTVSGRQTSEKCAVDCNCASGKCRSGKCR